MPDEIGETNMTNESIVDKIRKLKAKAEGTNNPHEAEAFAQKAAQLMEEYRVEVAQLEIGSTDYEMVEWTPWQLYEYDRLLMIALARTCGVKLVSSGKTYYLLGRQLAIDTCMDLYDFITEQMTRMAFAAYKKTREQRSYCEGIAIGVSEKLHQRAAEFLQSESRALVVQDDDRLTEFKNQQFPNLRKGQPIRVKSNTEEFHRGYHDHKSVRLSREIS